jgi:hypothetical protein
VNEFQIIIVIVVKKVDELCQLEIDAYEPKVQRISKVLFDLPTWINLLYNGMLKYSYGTMLERRYSLVVSLQDEDEEIQFNTLVGDKHC